MTYTTFVIRTSHELLEKLVEWSNQEKIWYRGQPHFQHLLRPSAYRKKEFTDHRRSQTVESNSLYRAKSDMFHISETYRLSTDLDWMCFLQHNGLSTRLLDFTTKVDVAIYFALRRFYEKRAKPGSFPCLWAIKPSTFSEQYSELLEEWPHYFKVKKPRKVGGVIKESYAAGLASLNDVERKDKDLLTDLYTPFVSSFMNERIRCQGGCFIRFPLHHKMKPPIFEKSSLDTFATENPSIGTSLCKFIFLYPNQMLDQLSVLNISDTNIFPEVATIASNLDRELFKN